ncbi:cation efflux protein, partial [Kipferlia bialata]|eukprot:g11387.t1
MVERETKVSVMMTFTGLLMLMELVVGLISHSLTLTADAFHMLSDTISLVVGLISIKISKRPADKSNSFGYQ